MSRQVDASYLTPMIMLGSPGLRSFRSMLSKLLFHTVSKSPLSLENPEKISIEQHAETLDISYQEYQLAKDNKDRLNLSAAVNG